MKTPNEQYVIAQLVTNELTSQKPFYSDIFGYEKDGQYRVAIAFNIGFIPGRMARNIGLLCDKYNVSWFVSDACSADHSYSLYIIIY